MSSMTLRERILTTLRGGHSDRTPWNIYAWLLPDTEAGWRMHAKGLSLMGTRRIFRTVYQGVELLEETRVENGETYYHSRIETPYGTLTEEARLDPTYHSRWIQKYFITGPKDYPAAEYFFRHTTFEPDYEPWLEAEREMGDKGFVIGEIMPIPIMTLLVAWTGIAGLADGLYEDRAGFDALLDALDQHYDRQIELAAGSPAEVIWFGDNVSGKFISPRHFSQVCLPVYARVMPVLRAAGKYPIAHYDGSNRPLHKLLAQTDLPIIEAFTPPPMGDLSVAEAKAAWPDKVVWVNFPGNLFLSSEEEIYAYTINLMWEGAPGGRFVIGCTEEYPLDQFEKTFSAIGCAMADFEGVAW